MAYWTEHEQLFGDEYYVCSKCGHASELPYDRCPECGSNMKHTPRYSPDFIDELETYDIFFD